MKEKSRDLLLRDDPLDIAQKTQGCVSVTVWPGGELGFPREELSPSAFTAFRDVERARERPCGCNWRAAGGGALAVRGPGVAAGSWCFYVSNWLATRQARSLSVSIWRFGRKPPGIAG